MSLKPIIAYYGGKRRLLKYILPLIPEHKVYVEPFVGGGSVYFAKPRSEVEVISDINQPLIEFYRTIRDISDIDTYPDLSLNVVQTIQEKLDAPIITPSDKIANYIISMCNGFISGKSEKKVVWKHNINRKMESIYKYRDRLRSTTIHNLSYQHIIEQYDSPDTFFYLDPPYVNTNVWYKNPSIDFIQLRHILDNIQGRFILSLNDSPFVRETFKDYYMMEVSLKVQGGMTPGKSFKICPGGSSVRKELIIWNNNSF